MAITDSFENEDREKVKGEGRFQHVHTGPEPRGGEIFPLSVCGSGHL